MRMLTEGGDTDAARINFAFRLVTSRTPTTAELQVLVSALADYRREFEASEKADRKVEPAPLAATSSAIVKDLSPADVAAATALANVLFNLDEVTTRE
jgi:hypothetical protein